MTAALDPNREQRLAADPMQHVWVTASAGSGKTKVLTDRVLALLLSGVRPQRILCLTFTKAGASEMAKRINDRLGRWARLDDAALAEELAGLPGAPNDPDRFDAARRLFARVLDAPGGLKIQTIHSFCESLLGRFPLEAGTPPHFEVMDERLALELMQTARDAVLAGADAEPAIGGAVAEISRRVQEDRFDELLLALVSERGRLRRLVGQHGEGLAAAVERLYRRLRAHPGLGEEDVVAAACEEDSFDRIGLGLAAEAMQRLGSDKSDRPAGRAIADWLAADDAGRIARYEAYRAAFLTQKLELRARLATKAVVEGDPSVADILSVEQARLLELEEQRRRQVTASASAALITLGARILAQYEVQKQRRARLDYDDLVLRARDLLQQGARAASWVLFKLDEGLEHILVDEAQDTAQEQWEVVKALADEFFAGEGQHESRRTVFVVGDFKQSIYSFQRADPDSFQAMRAYFARRAVEAGASLRETPLDFSFRSTPEVLRAVDAAFATPEAAAGVIDPAAEAAHLQHTAVRAEAQGLVELWPVVEPTERHEPEPWEPPVDTIAEPPPVERLADGLARRIAGWIGTVYLPSVRRTARAGDIMVLVRRRTVLVDALIRALKKRDVPVAGVDRMVLGEQIAVMDLAALGHFLLLPEDDLTLASVLKGPLCGLDDDDLVALTEGGGKRSLWRRLGDRAADDPRYASVRTWLADLLARVDYAPPYELYAYTLTNPCPAPVPADEAGPLTGRRGFAARLGVEAEEPVDEFLALALAYDRSHTPSLQGFLHWLSTGRSEIKRDLDTAERNELRILTVHGAKGLQAPIVVLPDTASKPGSGGAPLVMWGTGAAADGAPPLMFWTPHRRYEESVCGALRRDAELRQDQEYRRLLYVAMTRAEDRLYVCGYGGRQARPDDCWYDLIRNGLASLPDVEDVPFEEQGWTGAALRLAAAAEEAWPAEPAAAVAPEPVPGWALRPPPPEPTPPRPMAPSRPSGPEPAVRSPRLAGEEANRFRRGVLVHRLLQFLPEIEPDARDAAARRFLARPAHGLTGEQASEIAEEAMAVLKEPGFAALFGPDSRAEASIVGLVEGPQGPEVVSGQVDRLVVTPEAVEIVDYKTLRPPPDSAEDAPPAYLRQLALYRAVLVRTFPDRAVNCALLWTDGPRLMPVPGALLDRVWAPS